MNRVGLILIASLVLAGCSKQTDDVGTLTPGDDPLACVSTACPADLNHRDAKRALAEYNLTQITADDQDEGNIGVNGAWVTWQVYTPEENRTGWSSQDIVAFNMKTRELVPVEVDPGFHGTRPILRDRTAVFHVQSANGTDPLAIWEANKGAMVFLDSPFAKGGTISAFDGQWIGFPGEIEATSETGVYAWNMKTDELMFLYKSHPRNQLPDGSYETFTDMDIVDGVAYYSISRATPMIRGERQSYNSTIHEVNLTTGERREFFFGDSTNNFMAGPNFLVIAAGLEIWGLNLTSGTFFPISSSDQRTCGDVSMGGAWAGYGCGSGYWVKNLHTNQTIRIADNRILVSQGVTDGETVVVQAYPNDPDRYEVLKPNLYWYSLPPQ